MKRGYKFLAFLLCLVLFGTALYLSFFLSRDDVGDFHGDGTGHIVLSEILPSNRTYPNRKGEYLDYIELRNLTATPTDISGYMLSDALDSIGYTFPKGTILPAYGYIAVWCDKTCDTGEYAAFGISSKGTDTIFLYNSANVMVDSISLPRMNDNMPLIRLDSGEWETGSQATPGFENTPEGFDKWLNAMGALDKIDIVISEVMTANECTALDADGTVCDWVELWNTGDTDIDLSGAYLSDDPADAFKWQIPQMTIPASQRILIRCAGAGATANDATFALPRSGCTVVLTGSMGNTICKVEIPQIGRDTSWALQTDGTYAQSMEATPGFENNAEGYNHWLAAVNPADIQVVINEVMTANFSTITNAAGELCDWVELKNVGSSAADLSGCYLSDDPDNRSQFQIAELVLQPGETALIRCGGIDPAAGEATFSLKKSGCTLILTGSVGNVLTQLDVPALEDDRSWALEEDGTYVSTSHPTPGYPNTDQGWADYQLTKPAPEGPLMISEVMPSNSLYLVQADGKCYDWVELVNQSDSPLNLKDFALSNDPGYPDMMVLPDRTLAPGERIIIICSGNTELTGETIHAPFTLSRQESWVYVVNLNGGFSDFMHIYDVPYQGSVGRVTGESGTYYFTKPTPGTENGTGVAFISEAPTLETPDGVYNDIKTLDVVLSGPSEIRYTTDGSLPTATSKLYTGPISLKSTTVIRAASFEKDKLPSDAITAAYIINENHTLPVISIAVDPEEMFGGAGIHTNYYSEREIPCNLILFEGDEGFNIDCGIKMFGHMGLKNPKKSFKVNFRGRYGEDLLQYPVYGPDAPQYYDSLVVRAGQDYPLSIFRDELFTSLARDIGNNTLAQEDKYSILYINGRYWGIYCLKEAYCETMIANHYGVSQDSVEIIQAPVDNEYGTEILELIGDCWKSDMNDPEDWARISSQVDVDSLIDWMIMEAYSTNTDTQQNLRYFRSTEMGNKWMLAYYDIDWGWHYNAQFSHVLSPNYKWQHTGLTKNFTENKEFRQKLLKRLSELLETTLSDENVLNRINYYADLLDPEVRRERERWSSSYEAWLGRVEELRKFLANGHAKKMITNLDLFINLTREEKETYFGRWLN
ncbi:MAG: hypothetical protein E7465_02040 [Ruminococcaceae bacterium]|nr:hypothetical protein [Oscillospiraceae bacterium]